MRLQEFNAEGALSIMSNQLCSAIVSAVSGGYVQIMHSTLWEP